MKCLAEGLSLASINDKNKSLGEGSILSFQVAATHDMGTRIINGGNVRIRFRYRGPSPITGIEIWRKREIALKIVKVSGDVFIFYGNHEVLQAYTFPSFFHPGERAKDILSDLPI